MEFNCNSINKYLKFYNLKLELPDIKIYLSKGVYPPKLDSFLLAEELVKITVKGYEVLDIGTGSGILAIIASKKGANVVATDVHEESVKCARQNALINNVKLDVRVGDLFKKIGNDELFDVIISNPTSLPTPSNEQHDEYIMRTVDAGPDGRKFLDLLINQMPLFLKKGGYFLIQHSNFSNIEKTVNMLKELGFEVEVKIYEFPIGKTSAQRINYFIKYLPKNCHPFKKECDWYQRIGVFLARR